MKQLNKKLVDEAIRLNKKYYNNECIDYAAKWGSEKKAFGEDSYWVIEIINGITWKRKNLDEPYETYYKVLEVLGFEVVEE